MSRDLDTNLEAAEKDNSPEDEMLLEEIRKNYDYGTDELRDIRAEANIDMRYVSGDPWNPKDRKAREDADRPCISLDEINQYTNQIVNEVRANKRAIKVTPDGDGATDKTAELRAGWIRQREYASHAQETYTTAFENCVNRSFGWGRIIAKWVTGKPYQELWFEPIVNPNMVTWDPDAKKSTCSDMKWLFYAEPWRVADFKRKWKNAKIHDFSSYMHVAPSWCKGETILVAEYWTIETTTRTFYVLKPPPGKQPISIYGDELSETPQDSEILHQHEEDSPKVMQYFTNGVEILSKHAWPGKFIPFAACLGKVLYLEEGGQTKKKIMSLVRLARNPAMLYAYYRTTQAEIGGQVPKVTVAGYEGQFRGHETEWQRARHEPVAFLQFKGKTEATGDQLLPPPQQIAYSPGAELQAFELCAEGARRAIQAAMAVSALPTTAQRKNEKSGVALQEIKESEQRGSYHFVDHYEDMLRHFGVMLDDLAPKYHDVERDISIRKPNDTVEMVKLGDNKYGPDAMTTGTHGVTISTGPSFDSEREAGSALADTLVTEIKEIAAIAGPQKAVKLIALGIKLKNLGPIGDEIADMLSPPEPSGPDGKPRPPLPPEAQQAIAENQHLKQQLAQAADMIKTDAVKAQAAIDLANRKFQHDVMLQRMKDATSIAVAKINLLAKGIAADNEATNEAAALAQEQAHELVTQHESQAHEMALSAAEAQHAKEQADVQHQQALEQGDQGQAHALEQNQQAADLAPEPAEGV